MPWGKFDDKYFQHPKVRRLSPLARLLDMAGILYCSRQLTDGLVIRNDVLLVAAEAGIEEYRGLVAELVEVGRWEPDAQGYRIHDYLDYNPSRAQVMAEREAAKERMSRHRSGGCSGERTGEQDGERSGERTGERNADLRQCSGERTPPSRIPNPESHDSRSPASRAPARPPAREAAAGPATQPPPGREPPDPTPTEPMTEEVKAILRVTSPDDRLTVEGAIGQWRRNGREWGQVEWMLKQARNAAACGRSIRNLAGFGERLLRDAEEGKGAAFSEASPPPEEPPSADTLLYRENTAEYLRRKRARDKERQAAELAAAEGIIGNA